MIRYFLAIIVTLCIGIGSAQAVTPGEILSDPVLESRARALSVNLRCMVCQNQSIDDSDAPLAKDLRILVRERLVEGDTDDQVIDYLVSRYGEFVLLKPRFALHTLVLWSAGPLALLAGLISIFILIRRRAANPINPAYAPPLSEEEQRRLKVILDSKSSD